MTALPLRGLTVVEVAEGVAGPHCGRMLAAFGAEVVKVELPPDGDWSRREGPFLTEDRNREASALFLYNNTGKKSVLLDWRTPEGMARLHELAASADVLIEDWTLPLRERLDIATDAFTSASPGLVELCVTPFGLSGPYARWSSSPMVQLALGGYMYLIGEEDREPLSLPGRQADYLTGLGAYAAVQFALWERGRTGRGRFLELTMLETVATLHQYTYVMHTYEGLVRTRNGHRWERQGPFATYPNVVLPCADGLLCWGLAMEWQWDLLCVMMGREDLQNDPRFDTRQNRRANAEAIDEIILEWSKDRPRAPICSPRRRANGDWSPRRCSTWARCSTIPSIATAACSSGSSTRTLPPRTTQRSRSARPSARRSCPARRCWASTQPRFSRERLTCSTPLLATFALST